MKMEEYICFTAKPEDVQKKLNQWRHQYDLEIISMCSTEAYDPMDTWVVVLLKRTPKL